MLIEFTISSFTCLRPQKLSFQPPRAHSRSRTEGIAADWRYGYTYLESVWKIRVRWFAESRFIIIDVVLWIPDNAHLMREKEVQDWQEEGKSKKYWSIENSWKYCSSRYSWKLKYWYQDLSIPHESCRTSSQVWVTLGPDSRYESL
jgi:hypothetical protein